MDHLFPLKVTGSSKNLVWQRRARAKSETTSVAFIIHISLNIKIRKYCYTLSDIGVDLDMSTMWWCIMVTSNLSSRAKVTSLNSLDQENHKSLHMRLLLSLSIGPVVLRSITIKSYILMSYHHIKRIYISVSHVVAS